MLHQLRVGTVVDNISAKDGRGQRTVDFFGIDVLQLAIEDEVVAFGAQADSGLLAEKDEGEDIAVLRAKKLSVGWARAGVDQVWTHLFATAEKEFVRVNAVGDGAADKGHPVEDDGRVGAFPPHREQLVENVEDDGDSKQSAEASNGKEVCRLAAEARRKSVGHSRQQSHLVCLAVGRVWAVNGKQHGSSLKYSAIANGNE